MTPLSSPPPSILTHGLVSIAALSSLFFPVFSIVVRLRLHGILINATLISIAINSDLAARTQPPPQAKVPELLK